MNIEEKIFNACIWFIAVCVLAAILTSCSLYAAPSATATPAPTMTERVLRQDAKPTPTPQPITCTVTTGYQNGAVNFRTTPSTGAEVLRVLHEGERLQVIERGAWLNVLTRDNQAGFIYAKYCQ
jgi:Bacterial SH3 domain